MSLSPRERRALRYIRKFVAKARELIEEITVKDLIEEGGLNPYMVAALGIDSMEDAVELFVYRRVERSLGTSFGTVIEKFLRELLGGKSGKDLDPRCRGEGKKEQKPWICWWDIVLEQKVVEDGREYRGIVLSVKSGPADINKDIIETFVNHAREAEANGYRPYLVLTYGKRAFSVAVTSLSEMGLDPEKFLLVGREVFKKFLGDPNYYERAIDLIRSVGGGLDIFELMEKKVRELVEELRKTYGDDILRLLKDLS